MAVALLFTPASMDARRYDEVIRRLEQAGVDQFGRTLMPILQQMGIDPGQPEVVEIHNVIIGDVTSPAAGTSR
jgi:hypothetical protein